MIDYIQNCVNSLQELTKDAVYLGAPHPGDEQNRITTLKDLKLLDTLPQRSYDKITSFVCKLFDVPICLISLVDVNRQWFKSVQGLPGVTETSRDLSFCAWTLLPKNAEVLVVNDAKKDPRFKDNALVTGAPYIRFYAGCPLICSNGHRLGTLCAIGPHPRNFLREEAYLLCNITELTIREIEKSAANESNKHPNHFFLQGGTRKLLRSQSCYESGFCLLNLTQGTQQLEVQFVSERAEQLLDLKVEHQVLFWELFKSLKLNGEVMSEEKGSEKVVQMILDKKKTKCQLMCRTESGIKRWIEAIFVPATDSYLDKYMPFVSISQEMPSSTKEFCYYWIELKNCEPPAEKMVAMKTYLVGIEEASLGAYDSVITNQLLGQGSITGSMTYRGIYDGQAVVMKVWEVNRESYRALRCEVLQRMPQHERLIQVLGFLGKDTPRGSTQQCWIAEELCNQGNLASAVQDGMFASSRYQGECSASVVLLSCLDIVRGLQVIHEAGLYHGYLIPTNILLSSDENDYRGFNLKISDTGVHSVLERYHEVNNEIYGDYISRDMQSIDLSLDIQQKGDVYSFGKLMFLMVGEVTNGEPSRNLARTVLQKVRTLADLCVSEERPTIQYCLEALETIYKQASTSSDLLVRQSYEAED